MLYEIAVKIKALLRKAVCYASLRTIHLKTQKLEDGFHCVDCGFFKSKEEHMADLHAGGGW